VTAEPPGILLVADVNFVDMNRRILDAAGRRADAACDAGGPAVAAA
jgi:hypothetical protein